MGGRWREVGGVWVTWAPYALVVHARRGDFHLDFAPGETVQGFHHRESSGPVPAIWVPELRETPTVVLGSRQGIEDIDASAAKAAGIQVAQRRSGGGAVLVSATDLTWIDVVIGRGDPRWESDVTRSFDWLAIRLQQALASLGEDGDIHRGPLQRTEWSDLVCFAGLGPGEITVDGKKLVGISQRRTRDFARFQVAILREWRPGLLLSALRLRDTHRSSVENELSSFARGIGRPHEEVLEAVLSHVAAD